MMTMNGVKDTDFSWKSASNRKEGQEGQKLFVCFQFLIFSPTVNRLNTRSEKKL